MKQLVSTITYKSIYGIIYVVSMIPMPLLYGLSSFLYVITYYVLGYRKSVVVQNISRSFPEKRYEEVRYLARKFYATFAVYFVEVLKCVSTSPLKIDKKLSFVNLELIEQHILSGKNVVVCLGHCGNWELLTFLSYKLHHEMYAIYKPLRSKPINQLMIKLRSRYGMKMVQGKYAIRHILSNKSSASVYYFIADQCPRIKEENYRFDLLNQSTYFFSGMEKLARFSQSAVVYMDIVQTSKGKYEVTCTSVCENARSSKEGEITHIYASLLSESIRKEPHDWLWSHKRWKR